MRLWRRRHRQDELACRQVVEIVTQSIEGVMPADERRRFEAHHAGCEGCTAYVEDMRRIVGSLHEVAEPPPDAETREALVAAYRELRSG